MSVVGSSNRWQLKMNHGFSRDECLGTCKDKLVFTTYTYNGFVVDGSSSTD